MRPIIASLASVAALGLVAGPALAKDDSQQTRGEQQLERLIGDRVAGDPERCVTTFANARITIVDGEGIVVRNGSTVYLNRTSNPESLDADDILVIRRYGIDSNLCENEQLETYSRSGNFLTGLVSLEEFVPYARADKDEG
ncbi:hypothetical protein [Pseudoblastomonas halimionae]|uniref:Organic solvent tolerance-like N-terminal domain-containing protein n=1 Tax=Alteriqipengyuania halimionae TaxID=1926630 RepID=A0A6I4U5Z4_9SPHN|nr:hypothetical protein [Alteriqipengyuania halimionae]MXP11136.1 hypothetical protein [Alteriqipengyuania halimionae]